MQRLAIVTAGHPSTCPRMVKAADAAAAAGYRVRLVSVDYIDWAAPLDCAIVKRRQWTWTAVSLQRSARRFSSRWVSARQRLAATAVAHLDPEHAPVATVSRAYGRTHPEIVNAILAEPFDLVYGGTVGALAAVAEAARRVKRPFGLDFEDFHPAESEEADAEFTHALASRVIRDAVVGSAFTTAASAPIAAAYASQFSTTPVVIHNVVPLVPPPPSCDHSQGPLRLYWFSQIIGPRRGLEDVVRGVARAGVPVRLHLRGVARQPYVDALVQLAADERADLEITVHPPGDPDAMVELCANFDIGLSLEQEGVSNRALCLPNKPLTYMAAGLALIATDTAGQRTFAPEIGDGAWWYRPGDVERLAEGLRHWHADRQALKRARQSSYRAAVERFHWEHPLERGALLAQFAGALS